MGVVPTRTKGQTLWYSRYTYIYCTLWVEGFKENGRWGGGGRRKNRRWTIDWGEREGGGMGEVRGWGGGGLKAKTGMTDCNWNDGLPGTIPKIIAS
jgi:hypothetical protein